ncbi:hypothetical protein GX865_03415, partial [Candidatus Saccharibacteria bacterium]|nr:hypothetical protein [Candidatus Saccharibacteria bacterium]
IIESIYTIFVAISILACVPQVLQLLRVKQSTEFELRTWTIWLVSQTISTIYFFEIKAYLVAIFAIGWSLFYLAMVALIIYYRYRPGSETLAPVRVPTCSGEDFLNKNTP